MLQNKLKYGHSNIQRKKLKKLGTGRYLNIKQMWKIKEIRGYIIVTNIMYAGPPFSGTEVKKIWKGPCACY